MELPNVELADSLIKRWDDRPEPAGFGPYPIYWGLRTERTTSHNSETNQMTIHPGGGMFDHAVPYLGGQPLEPAEVRLTGMRNKDIFFKLPSCPFEVAAVVGDTQYQQPLRLEEVVLDLRDEPPVGDELPTQPAGERCVVELCFRRSFHYAYVPRQRRHAWMKLRGAE